MPEERRFARLRRGSVPEGEGVSVVPDEGMCLSAFLVVRPPGRERTVLFGRPNPAGPWARVGALDPGRVARFGDGWMLPSSHLLLFESPQDAARRIAREQLGAELPAPERSSAHSEAYRRSGETSGDPHWDLHFVTEVRWPTSDPPTGGPWTALSFLDLDRLRPEEVLRGQADVLGLVGLTVGTTPPGAAPAAAPSGSGGRGRTRRR